MSRKKYRPLSFSTTLRNPQRIQQFLEVISQYENHIFTNETIIKIIEDVIMQGYYKPSKANNEIKQKWREYKTLSKEESQLLIKNNPQDHKEANFDHGWPSRFATWYALPLEFGLIHYEFNKPIIISNISKQFLKGEISFQELFKSVMKNYWSDNPYRKGIKNHVQPLRLLMKALTTLPSLEFDQIHALLCAPNMDFLSYKDIIVIPTKEKIERLWGNKFNKNAYERRKEGVDDFIRKMFLTGWIRYSSKPIKKISIEPKCLDEINEYLQTEVIFFSDEMSYCRHLGQSVQVHSDVIFKESSNPFQYWLNKLSIEEMTSELRNITTKRKTNIPDLKYVDSFILLEFFIALIIAKTHNNITVKPNMNFNSDNIPTSPAPGGVPDITLQINNKIINVEVTLLNGTSQHKMESFSTVRHARENGANSLLFIAPTISHDLVSNYQFEYSRSINKIDLVPITIATFLNNINDNILDVITKYSIYIRESQKYQSKDLIDIF